MKKLYALLLVCTFLLIGTQVVASPPVHDGPEEFIIVDEEHIYYTGDYSTSHELTWTYFEGWGKGVFYPNGYDPSECCCRGCGAGFYDGYVVSELGFTEGAEIAYKQTFDAKDAVPNSKYWWDLRLEASPDPGEDNLVVTKEIIYNQATPAGYAKHEEKVGLAVISMGAAGSTGAPASGLLSLCPWAAESGGTTGGAYPPTNEGIAAGSSFNVTNIHFDSKSVVNSSINPALSYNVTAVGKGEIAAGFVAAIWEGPDGYVWGPYLASDYCLNCRACPCLPQSTHIVQIPGDGYMVVPNDCYILPQVYGEPPLAKRARYEEHASATGVWSFIKQVSYESVMPGAPGASLFPFNQVPVPGPPE